MVQNVARSVLVLFLPIRHDEWPRPIEPFPSPDEFVDVAKIQFLRVVTPSGLVVNVSGQQLGADAFRGVAPGAMVAGIVFPCSSRPCVD